MREKEQALRLLDVLQEELDNVPNSARLIGSFGVHDFGNLRKWKARAVEMISTHISLVEGQNLDNTPVFYSFTTHPIADEIRTYNEFLGRLADAIERSPESVLATVSSNSTNKEKEVAVDSPEKNVIFIVHGHDEINLYRLEKLLTEHFKLKSMAITYLTHKEFRRTMYV